MEEFSKRTMLVGILVGAALAATMLAILFVSPDTLKRKIELQTRYSDVAGLQEESSPVRVAGVYAGKVLKIEYYHENGEAGVIVHMEIIAEPFHEQIREGSVARVKTQGLLGKKYIAISIGDPAKPKIPAGAEVPSEELPELSHFVAKGTAIADKLESALASIDLMLADFQESGTMDRVSAAADNVGEIAQQIASGKGLIGALIYDESTRNVAADLNDIVARIDRVTARLETGPGLAHALVYDPAGGTMVENVSATTTDIRELVGNLRGAGAELGEEQRRNLIEDLTATAAALRHVAEQVEQGEGTLGALVEDPTVYEDLKTLLGGAQRSRILRAVVRYAIRLNETEPVPPE